MAKIQYEDGTVIEFEGDPTHEDIESAYQQARGGSQSSQPSFSGQELAEPAEQPKPSPVNLIDRLRLAGGNDSGREAFLKEKFPYVAQLPDGRFVAGNSSSDMAPVDPDGMLNDVLGELSETAGFIARITPSVVGQVGGTVAGGMLGGIPGAIAGASVGSAGGELIGQQIQQNLMKTEQMSREEKITDAAIAGVFGGVGEGIGQALKLGANRLNREAVKDAFKSASISEAERVPGQLARSEKVASKVLSVTAGVPEEAPAIIFRDGVDNVITAFNENPKSIVKLVDDTQNAIADYESQLGKQIHVSLKDFLKKTAGNAEIDMAQAQQGLFNDLKEAGVLLRGNFMAPNTKGIEPDATIFKELLEYLENPNLIRGGRGNLTEASLKEMAQRSQFQAFGAIPRKLTLRESLVLENRFSNLYDKLSDDGQRVMAKFLGGGQAKEMGLRPALAQVAQKVGADDWLSAKAAFSSFKDLVKEISDNGLRINNKSSLGNFITGFFGRNQQQKVAIEQLDKIVPGELLGNIERFAAVQALNSVKVNLLRFGMVAATVGAAFDPSILGRMSKLGGGLLVGTPAGVKQILKVMAKGKGLGIKTLPSKIGSGILKANQAQNRALLSQLVARQRSISSRSSSDPRR